MSNFYKTQEKNSGDLFTVTDWNEMDAAMKGGKSLKLATEAAERVEIGDPAIEGAVSPKLQVGGTVTATAFDGDGSRLTNLDPANMRDAAFQKSTTDASHLYLNDDFSHVGIGTQTPQETLHVNGKTRIEDTLNVNGAITVNNKQPFVYTYYDLTDNAMFKTNFKASDYVLTIAGFNIVSKETGSIGGTEVYTYTKNGYWYVRSDLINRSETMQIMVLAIRKELVEVGNIIER